MMILERKDKKLFEDKRPIPSMAEARQHLLDYLAIPLTLEQKIEWVKKYPGTTAKACDVSADEVLLHPEKYAKMMVC